MRSYKELLYKKEINNDKKKIINDKSDDFFIYLLNNFSEKHKSLLKNRKNFNLNIKNGEKLNFIKETKGIRNGKWEAKPIPKELLNRKVEITGPVDRKMIINGLNSKAMVYMADFEDSQSPTWEGIIEGQVNLYDAVRKQIDFVNQAGKEYKLNQEIAELLVRVRGLHMFEKHVEYLGQEVPAGLFDFAFYFFHNVAERLKQGKGLYLYLPKLEHYQEARFWKEVFEAAEDYFDLERGTIKVTVLIETITAVFEMDEIIYELQDYCVGLNCGRWDYIFSFIKQQYHLEDKVLPHRDFVNMGTPFLRAYSKLLIDTCHKRGVLAMGGMAAQIPVKGDEEKNELALNKVRADKEREASTGHDGTWVAHPGLVGLALKIFDDHIPGDNQLSKRLSEVEDITNHDLLAIPDGEITLEGFRNNLEVSLHYLAAWVSGNGCVPINHLMEDLATAEIARSQIWQWIHNPATTFSNGDKISLDLFNEELETAMETIMQNQEKMVSGKDFYQKAKVLLKEIIVDTNFTNFLSLPAYDLLD